MSELVLQNAGLPTKINCRTVRYIFSLLDYPEIDNKAMVKKMGALDFMNRIFANDRNGEARKTFLENGIYEKLDCLLKDSTEKNDKLSLLLTTASFGLIYQLLSIPSEEQKVTIPLHFLKYFLTIISENKLDPAVQLAVSCLCLLHWRQSEMNYFMQLLGLETLLKTAKFSRRDVLIDIIKIFANFAAKVNPQIKLHMINIDLFKYIIEICNKYFEKKLEFGGNVDNLLMQCMIFFNNFMFKYYRGKLEFYKLKGMKTITKLYLTHPNEKLCKIYVGKVLNILIYYKNNKIEHQDFYYCPNRDGQFSLKKRYPPPMKIVEEKLSDCQLHEDTILENRLVVQTTERQKSYQIGSVVPFVNNSTHAIMPSDVLFPAEMDEVGKTVCGMLNCQKKCTIYFGINSNSYKVEGKELNRDARDKFRLICDTISSTLKPSMLYANIHVDFVPIKDGEDVIQDFFIAEIHIQPCDEFFHFKNKTYYRHFGQTVRLNAEELQILVICEEKKKWQEEEQKLLKELNELKEHFIDYEHYPCEY